MKNKTQLFCILFTFAIVSFIGCGYSEEDDDEVLALPFNGQQDSVGPLSNRNPRFIGSKVQLSRGDILQIIPTDMTRDKIIQSVTSPKRQDNQTCVQSESLCHQEEPVFQQQCHQSCHVCVKCSFPLGCYPASCCDTNCSNVQMGTRCILPETRCLKNENQWTDVRIFSEPQLSGTENVNDVVERNKLLLTGMKIQFVDQEGKNRGGPCSLANFNPLIEGGMISIPIVNPKDCPHIFAEKENTKLGILVSNQIVKRDAFQVGIETHTWDDRTLPPTKTLDLDRTVNFTINLRVPSR